MNGVSVEQKLDTVLLELRDIKSILHGEEDRPGLMSEMSGVKKTVYGYDGDIGDHHRTAVMWRAHVWLLCSGSGALGCVLTLFVKWALGK